MLMKVYALGDNFESKTQEKVLVTIELLPTTDMKGLECCETLLTNPFYRELKINSGKVTKITDLTEEYEYTTALLPCGDMCTMFECDKYFDIKGYNDTTCIIAYQYKIAAAEGADYVHKDYSGMRDTHYPNGNMRTRCNYVKGVLHSQRFHRNNLYNTMERVCLYNQGIIECEFTYDDRETLIRQVWYTSKGEVYSEKDLTSRAPRPPAPRPPAAAALVPEHEVTDDSSTGSDSSSQEMDITDGGGCNSGCNSGSNDVGGGSGSKGPCNVRIKPRDDD